MPTLEGSPPHSAAARILASAMSRKSLRSGLAGTGAQEWLRLGETMFAMVYENGDSRCAYEKLIQPKCRGNPMAAKVQRVKTLAGREQ